MKVDFVSRAVIEQVVPNEHVALISIRDPKRDAPTLHKLWKYVLRLAFHDVDGVRGAWVFDGAEENEYINFTEDDARKILEFIDMLPKDIEHIVVHCEGGVSRSAAVARFIAEKYECYFPHEYQLDNRHVYSTLKRLSMEDSYEDE